MWQSCDTMDTCTRFKNDCTCIYGVPLCFNDVFLVILLFLALFSWSLLSDSSLLMLFSIGWSIQFKPHPPSSYLFFPSSVCAFPVIFRIKLFFLCLFFYFRLLLHQLFQLILECKKSVAIATTRRVVDHAHFLVGSFRFWFCPSVVLLQNSINMRCI